MTDVQSPTSSTSDVTALRGTVRGDVLLPGDATYDGARALFNGMIDRRPAVIVQCTDSADVIQALSFARQQGLRVAVRGGGHNGGGLGSVDGGLVIDLRRMDGVRVDPQARTVRVEGGATWGQVDHATHAFSLAVPCGVISTTGVGGLTLGGGLGYLTRRYGLTIDHLLEADVVLADGQQVTASEQSNADLYWAIRGGGGNFGIVTSFLFRAQPVSTVVGGPTLWPLEKAPQVLRWFQEFIRNAPDGLSGFFALLTVPPGPPFPEALHLQKMCGVVWCYSGPQERADEVFAPVAAFGPPALHGVQPMPFPALQSAFDGLYTSGQQQYWRGDFFGALDDAAIDALCARGASMPTWLSTIHLYPVGGAAHRVPADATAWSYRDADFAAVYYGVDPAPAGADAIRDWTVTTWEALHGFSMGGSYVNFMMEEGQERVQATYRDNYERLARIKGRYDPGNVFSVNQNIKPG
ncbi:FAD-binding oxidoreductase [Deinococcus sp. KSM4-11]|uniref:FAD-binding oxidoreductase n=1 Tax=Deinococcus sp. KSM4-11 TaxID=2568654 RepID=UPI0010A42EC1|nr:FAD-binding oxidoreductase [Deinococcus sp. KSM4-11]THF84964.1 FAD-binding oxidoreductase [Deinococcus sp. KSM4-11]